MRRSKFSEEQIVMALRHGEAGTSVEEICRQLGVSQTTHFRWKKTYGSLGWKTEYNNDRRHGSLA